MTGAQDLLSLSTASLGEKMFRTEWKAAIASERRPTEEAAVRKKERTES